MKANVWMGTKRLQVQEVPDPKILNQRDAIIKVSSTAICGSDLHLYDGFIPSMEHGDILGHEFMGEVVETGSAVGNLKKGDRVVVPFPIACGNCTNCERGQTAVCENSNPNAGMAEKLWGHTTSGIFGYSHMTGGFAGGQAEYVRVPFADFGPMKIENDSLTDDQVLFLTDIFPTGWMGAEFCDIQGGETVAVWGAGPVGLFTAQSAQIMGASKVIVIDRFPYRLEMARTSLGVDTINYEEVDVLDTLKEMTGGRGPDGAIDAVGMEAHHPSTIIAGYDHAKQLVRSETGRPHALRQAIRAVRSGGNIGLIGVYGGLIDKFPIGSLMNRGITLRSGQTHVHKYMPKLLDLIEKGKVDTTFLITHHAPLDKAPEMYKLFRDKQDDCVKVVLKAS